MDHLEWTIPSMDDDWGYPSRMLQIWGHGTSDEVKWLRESELKHGRVVREPREVEAVSPTKVAYGYSEWTFGWINLEKNIISEFDAPFVDICSRGCPGPIGE